MRRVKRVGALLVFLLTVMGGMAPVLAGRGPARSEEAGSVRAQDGHTVYLPLVSRYYDPSYVSPFGIVMYGPVDASEGLTRMQEAGSRWVTTALSWASIEPQKGQYHWDGFDAKARNAQSAGMEVFVLFTGNPSWAAASSDGPVTNTQDLKDFVSQAVERYDCDGIDDAPGSPCVHWWSFYAEPDRNNRWGYQGANYAAMLREISPLIHAINPRARVLIGGIAYDWFTDDPSPGPFVRSFLTDTLQALNTYPGGARAYIDAVAFHFYPISGFRWPTIRDKALEIRGIMERHGVGDLVLLNPEMGFWSSPKFYSSETIQARRLVQMFARALSVHVQPLSWYKVFDDVVAGSEEDRWAALTMGLLRKDGTPKPSYFAYRAMTRELAGARYLRDFQAPGVEGYTFRTPEGREKTVLWSKDETSHPVDFPYACLRLVDLDGDVFFPVRDGDRNWDWDGAVNGQIRLGIYPDPSYVEPCP